MKKILYTLLLTILSAWTYAQNSPDTGQTASGMRSNGKIYVVMVVVITIVAGLLLYLLNLDRKISKLEKQNP